MLSNYFSVWTFLSFHRFDLALHANSMMLFPYSMFLFLNKKKIGGENVGNFLFSFFRHVKYCSYFCLISQFIVH
jgi:hypothetical protein